ncbi:GNAT family N-acetyltransferase [Dechloromonas sp. XY25]|uniref:GNAT family N-acetyltransferase n=1 Tax=Dechloromonas hankyongensis TaxID=2908002 RepID=A0ABS9K6V5_9RHOO|nr:GNAT family N-acetyltransferase [Dechloromonas hankyongensis]MCG2578876.1 GNAT family N-acetyltransferase [Dechloromonas hankyongensis]
MPVALFPDAAGEFAFLTGESAAERWDQALANASVQPVGYRRCHLAYQHAYFSSAYADYHSFDHLISWRGEVVALCPLAAFRQDGQWVLSSHLNGIVGVAPPLPLVALPEKASRQLHQAWLQAVAVLAKQLGSNTRLRFTAPTPCPTAPDWYRRLLQLGASAHLRHRMLIDLALSEADYHRQLRKSYKALINQARRLWQVDLDTEGNAASFADFQAFHEQVAGRRTRPQATWDEQLRAIRQRSAFAIYLREADGRMVGASLYNCSRNEVYYAVGVYDRALFDQPVAHLSLDAAIRHARATGRHRVILGDRPFPGDMAKPSEKEAKIAFFKEGFATELQLLPTLDIIGEQLAHLCPSEEQPT